LRWRVIIARIFSAAWPGLIAGCYPAQVGKALPPSTVPHPASLDLLAEFNPLIRELSAAPSDVLSEVSRMTVIGTVGADEMVASAGPEAFNGLGGRDIVSYAKASAGIVVSLKHPLGNRGDAGGDAYSEIEIIIGSDHDDILVGDDVDVASVGNGLIGGPGNDLLVGLGSRDSLEGGAGNDVLLGGYDWDTLNGGPGDDLLDGGASLDFYDGGPGDDVYVFVSGEIENDNVFNFEGAGKPGGDLLVFKGFGTGAVLQPGPGLGWVAKSADGQLLETIFISHGSLGLGPDDYRFE
jgi:Ca2+-binding RTX toxin-like protein